MGSNCSCRKNYEDSENFNVIRSSTSSIQRSVQNESASFQNIESMNISPFFKSHRLPRDSISPEEEAKMFSFCTPITLAGTTEKKIWAHKPNCNEHSDNSVHPVDSSAESEMDSIKKTLFSLSSSSQATTLRSYLTPSESNANQSSFNRNSQSIHRRSSSSNYQRGSSVMPGSLKRKKRSLTVLENRILLKDIILRRSEENKIYSADDNSVNVMSRGIFIPNNEDIANQEYITPKKLKIGRYKDLCIDLPPMSSENQSKTIEKPPRTYKDAQQLQHEAELLAIYKRQWPLSRENMMSSHTHSRPRTPGIQSPGFYYENAGTGYSIDKTSITEFEGSNTGRTFNDNYSSYHKEMPLRSHSNSKDKLINDTPQLTHEDQKQDEQQFEIISEETNSNPGYDSTLGHENRDLDALFNCENIYVEEEQNIPQTRNTFDEIFNNRQASYRSPTNDSEHNALFKSCYNSARLARSKLESKRLEHENDLANGDDSDDENFSTGLGKCTPEIAAMMKRDEVDAADQIIIDQTEDFQLISTSSQAQRRLFEQEQQFSMSGIQCNLLTQDLR